MFTAPGNMLDTAGPEFRVRPGQDVELHAAQDVIISARLREEDHKKTIVYIDMPNGFDGFSQEAKGKVVRLNDAACEAIIESVDGLQLCVRLKQTIRLRGKEKVNFPGIDLRKVPSIGPKDRETLEFFFHIPISADSKDCVPIDYVAQSFVKQARDVYDLKAHLDGIRKSQEFEPLIIPKLETIESVQEANLLEIIKCEHTAAVMIARGDLANETSRGEVPQLQRRIIDACHSHWKPVLLATQVYGSMENPDIWQSSRPEAEDLRSALDWAIDGVVFTAETVKRRDPEKVIECLLHQVRSDEKHIRDEQLYGRRQNMRREEFEQRYLDLLNGNKRGLRDFPLKDYKDFSTADMAHGAVGRANNRRAGGLFAFTITGNTVRDMVHFLPYGPIFAFTHTRATVSRILLYRGVHPILVKFGNQQEEDEFDVRELKELMISAMNAFEINGGEAIAIGTMAHPILDIGGTDTLVWIRKA